MQVTKKSRLARFTILAFFMSMVLWAGSVADAHAADIQEPASKEYQENNAAQKDEKYKSVVKAVFCAGTKGALGIENAKGAVKWSVVDKDILQIVKKTNKICKVKALKEGKTSVRASAGGNVCKPALQCGGYCEWKEILHRRHAGKRFYISEHGQKTNLLCNPWHGEPGVNAAVYSL